MQTQIYIHFFVALAGLASFLSPCVLPLVPPYLTYLGGTTMEQLAGQDQVDARLWRRVVLAAVFFVLGFTTVFIGLGAGASVLGQWIQVHKSELAVVGFDPVGGPGAELARIPLEAGTSADIGFDYTWQLSPDGSRIGIVKRHGSQIRLVPLRGGQTTTITVKGFPDLLDMNWAVDSKGMFVSTVQPGGSTLLRVAPNGDAQPIWQQHQSKLTWGIPSPDGRHLAILGPSSEANVWMIGNF